MNKAEKAALDAAHHDARLTLLKLKKAREKSKRKGDVGMLAAYYAAKGLAELLGAIDDPDLGFHPHDAACIREAHTHAVAVVSALNLTIIDYGNGNTRETGNVEQGS